MEEVETLVEKWKPVLGLSDWTIHIFIRKKLDKEDKTCEASIKCDQKYKDADLEIYPPFSVATNKVKEMLIVHELVHVLLWRLEPHLAKSGDDSLEEVVQTLTQLFIKVSGLHEKNVDDVIRKWYNKMPLDQLAARLGLSYEQTRWKARMMGLTKGKRQKLVMDVDEKLLERQAKREEKLKDTQLLEALMEVETLRKKLSVAQAIREPVNKFEIKSMKGRGGEATMVALASDWHVEESIESANVNDLNFYNLEESKRRATQYFQVLLRLIEIEQNETKVENLILALLGDFISSDIHMDIAKSCLLEPTHAIQRCKEYLVSGIDYLLKNSKLKITIVCHTGNHGRKDKEQMIANEAGNSLEWLMYQNLADIYRNEKRLTFVIPEGYHSYVTVYDTVLRFHHGHSIKYGGGIGGITIPVNKAIAQWNRAKKADIDCFGHYHQIFDGGNFVANGSMIGYSPYAISIKAGYERPAQMCFGIHSKLGKYVTRPIYFI